MVVVVVQYTYLRRWRREKLRKVKRINLKGVLTHCDKTPFKFIRAWVYYIWRWHGTKCVTFCRHRGGGGGAIYISAAVKEGKVAGSEAYKLEGSLNALRWDSLQIFTGVGVLFLKKWRHKMRKISCASWLWWGCNIHICGGEGGKSCRKWSV